MKLIFKPHPEYAYVWIVKPKLLVKSPGEWAIYMHANDPIEVEHFVLVPHAN